MGLGTSKPVRWTVRRAKVLSQKRLFRRATSRARILPFYLVIGTQTAETTSLITGLYRHPDVAAPTAGKVEVAWSKELHFFDDRFWRGLGWYRSFFPLSATQAFIRRRGGELVAGEATPSYLFHPAAPARVAATLPDVRLIALLRDPVERAHAHYESMRRKGAENLSFEDALAEEEERLAGEEERILTDPHYPNHRYRDYAYVARGLYADQLERWLAYFPREQLLVLRAEDFRVRTAEIYAEVLAFLGLRSWDAPRFSPQKLGSYAPIDPALRSRLEEQFAEPNARLARLLNRDFGWGSATAPAKPADGGAETASTPEPQRT